MRPSNWEVIRLSTVRSESTDDHLCGRQESPFNQKWRKPSRQSSSMKNANESNSKEESKEEWKLASFCFCRRPSLSLVLRPTCLIKFWFQKILFRMFYYFHRSKMLLWSLFRGYSCSLPYELILHLSTSSPHRGTNTHPPTNASC